MIPISEDASLFLLDITENNEIIFRTTRNPAHLQKEKFTTKGNLCYLNLYYFPVEFLNKLLSLTNKTLK